jgi:hypothetical protein
MAILLEPVIAAHGGRQRWNQYRTLTARNQVRGPFWAFTGRPGFLGDELVVAGTRQQKIRPHRQDGEPAGRAIEFGNDTRHVRVTDGDGVLIAERTDPRASFAGLDSGLAWDAARVAYFISYATWHYSTEPFLFTYRGVQTEEIALWAQHGQIWRGLRVTFPAWLANHNRRQLYYFDGTGMQRRMDYQPEVNGFAPTAHYTYAEQTFDGIVVPTKRRIHSRRPDRSADRSCTPHHARHQRRQIQLRRQARNY